MTGLRPTAKQRALLQRLRNGETLKSYRLFGERIRYSIGEEKVHRGTVGSCGWNGWITEDTTPNNDTLYQTHYRLTVRGFALTDAPEQEPNEETK